MKRTRVEGGGEKNKSRAVLKSTRESRVNRLGLDIYKEMLYCTAISTKEKGRVRMITVLYG